MSDKLYINLMFLKNYKLKKFLYVLFILLVVISSMIFTACNPTQNPKLKIVTIGDSIAEAILGPSPLSERESFGYWAIIGKINGYECYNRSVSGHKTAQLLEVISAEEEDATMTITHLMTADVIQVSILGNDFLQNNITGIVLDSLQNNFDYANEIAKKSTVEFAAVIAKLKQLNPEALIIVQTVYNPIYLGSKFVSQSDIDKFDLDEQSIREAGNNVLNILNSIVYDYLEENPGAYEIADVYTAFNDIYINDRERGLNLLFPDDVHPSNEGHAVIACCTQKILEKHNLADGKSALRNYKKMQVELAERIYPENDNDTLKREINNAKSMDEVVEIFFRLTKNQVPSY